MQQKFSIKDLESLTGIKAHTLRIWEQRYHLLSPSRTDTNIRTYDIADLKKILNVSVLYKNGIKISKIASLPDYQINAEVERITNKFENADNQIEGLTIALTSMDEDRFNGIVSNCLIHFGFEFTMEKIIFPFLKHIGVLWQTGSISPIQEHFISNLIRQKIIVAINNVSSSTSATKKTAILFLPENELHEISLLYYNYICKIKGLHTIYLGQSVPFKDLEEVISHRPAELLISVFTNKKSKADIQKQIDRLASGFKNSTILLSGYSVLNQDYSLSENMKIFREPADLRLMLDAV